MLESAAEPGEKYDHSHRPPEQAAQSWDYFKWFYTPFSKPSAKEIYELLRTRPPLQRIMRRAVRACEVGGTAIPAAALLMLLPGSANRDDAGPTRTLSISIAMRTAGSDRGLRRG